MLERFIGLLRFLAPGRWQRRRRLLSRLRYIGDVVARHGLGWAFTRIRLTRFLPAGRRRRFPASPQGDLATQEELGSRIRCILEELGPTFIKLGQQLSTRPDLLPIPVWRSLQELQDRVPPLPWEPMAEAFRQALGRRPEDVFAEIDPVPLASASLGQVYRARLRRSDGAGSGERVAVKIRRPGVVEEIETDLELLYWVAERAQAVLAPEFVDLGEVAREFERFIHAELDYEREARTMEFFRRRLSEAGELHIPRVHWELTRPGVLVMEYVEGVKVNDLEGLDRLGLDRRNIARQGARLVLSMIFDHGLVHGDPHPGNILVEPGGTIALLDFGLAGHLRPEVVRELSRILTGVIRRDPEQVIRALLGLGIAPAELDRKALADDLEEIISRHWGQELADISFTMLLGETLEIAYRHHLRLPRELLLLIKALGALEGVGRQLDPEFNAFEMAAPFARRLLLREATVGLVGRVVEETREVAGTLSGWPEKLDQILDQLAGGRLTVRFEHRGLEETERVAAEVGRRMNAALLAAALLIAAGTGLEAWRGPARTLAVAGAQIPLTWIWLILLAAAIGLGIYSLRPVRVHLRTSRGAAGGREKNE